MIEVDKYNMCPKQTANLLNFMRIY